VYPSVHAAWHAFSEPFEGRVLSMYLDIKGLVTCGVGNLIDTPGEAQKLPWRKENGQPATRYEIGEAWHRLKGAQELRFKSVSHARALTGLVLTDADVDALVERKLRENDAYITEHWFPGFQEIPADAQLAVLSMAWAVGPAFNTKFPIFTTSARAGKWLDCARGCTIREDGNPGVIPRNRANRLCFENAGIVAANGLDRSFLNWPSEPRALPSLDRPEDSPPLAAPVDHAANDRAANLLGVRTLEVLVADLRPGIPSEPDHDEETKPEVS
jgi:GH24 family phage-related lysozyme (muramidase)